MEKNKHIILFNLRTNMNYSYADMAKILGISKTFYWQIENKKRRLYYDMAISIATIFDLMPDDIFHEKSQLRYKTS